MPSHPSQKKLVVITGPTASGKTALAIEVARKLKTEILSADSRQIYQEMSIGTAVPSAEQLGAVPHHFVHTHSIHQTFTAGDFEREGMELLFDLFKTKDYVILCGGSGLYIDAICSGFDELPEPKEGERERLNQLYKEKGIGVLQELLRRADPEYYEQVDQQNPQRLIRALEVCSSGTKYSDSRKGAQKKRPFGIIWVILDPPRDVLYASIDKRVDDMIKNGWVEEARSLYPYRLNNALQTVGYTELFGYFDGTIPLAEAIEKIKTNSRNYAKRQTTWLRRKEGLRLSLADKTSIELILEACR